MCGVVGQNTFQGSHKIFSSYGKTWARFSDTFQLPSMLLYISGYPLHRENRENGQTNPCQGIHRDFGNIAKTQGIWFSHYVNSLILKVKDILIFAAKNSKKI